MQSNIVITDSAKFEEIITSFESSFKIIQDIIAKEYKNVEKINETEVWSGPSAKSMYEKYKELNSNYKLIEYSLDLYAKFMRKTLEDYRRIDEETRKNIDDMASNLDVNS